VKLGRLPLEQSPSSVNCETTRACVNDASVHFSLIVGKNAQESALFREIVRLLRSVVEVNAEQDQNPGTDSADHGSVNRYRALLDTLKNDFHARTTAKT
jgi:hypothetical protein